VGVVFIAKTPGYQSDLMGYLFGNILLVPRESLWFMAALDALLLSLVWAYHRQLLAVVFDEELARLRGLPVAFFYLLLLVMVAVTVVLLVQVVGLILVLALLTLPAAVAGHYVHTLTRMMVLATLLGALISTAGLALSYGPDLPAGPTIVLLAGAVYLTSALLTQGLLARRARRAAAASVRGVAGA
jgi:zinc transport system permease protein